MAAPTYPWEFVCDLFGDRVPKIATLYAASGLETKIGTMVSEVAGAVTATVNGTGGGIIGLAAEAITVAATVGDPIKVALIGQGMVIKGTADADVSAQSGFNAKTHDVGSDGRLISGDTSGGGLSVWRTEDSGLTVYCVPTVGAAF
jgi:hypothetical protein